MAAGVCPCTGGSWKFLEGWNARSGCGGRQGALSRHPDTSSKTAIQPCCMLNAKESDGLDAACGSDFQGVGDTGVVRCERSPVGHDGRPSRRKRWSILALAWRCALPLRLSGRHCKALAVCFLAQAGCLRQPLISNVGLHLPTSEKPECFNCAPTASAATRIFFLSLQTHAFAHSSAPSARLARKASWLVSALTAEVSWSLVLGVPRPNWPNFPHRRKEC